MRQFPKFHNACVPCAWKVKVKQNDLSVPNLVNERKRKGKKQNQVCARSYAVSFIISKLPPGHAFSPPRSFPGRCRHVAQHRRRSTASVCLWSQKPLCDHERANLSCPVLLRPMRLRPPLSQPQPLAGPAFQLQVPLPQHRESPGWFPDLRCWGYATSAMSALKAQRKGLHNC